jgi:hypothetical protein
VTIEIEVLGNKRITHMVNGVKVIEYNHPQLDDEDADAIKLIENGNLMLSDGYIALQSESHPTEFRKIEILELNK